jgi:eukaryotic-like serine/threonine-protein kinase
MPEKLGRYVIVRELGKGAMGIVYEGKDPNIGRRVAIKTARRDVMQASGMADEIMARFLREARAAGQLNHPNIITIYDAGEENGIAWIAMEYLEGGDLHDLVKKRRTLEMKEIVEIGALICEALASAHDRGIIHRDIKPANMMLADDGAVKVADFGIAHVSDSNLTQDGALIGTPHYMSPEQFMGQKVDGRSDLYSVAIMLYELLTGEKPFTGEALSTVMHHCIKTDPVPPKELNFAVGDPINTVIMKALSKSPEDRYPDGRAMAAALRESLSPAPDPAILTLAAATGETARMAPRDAAADETVVTASDADATVAGGPPPGVEAAAPAEAAAAMEGPTPGARKKVLLFAAAAVVLVVLGGLAVMLASGGSEAPGGDSAAVPENYFDAFSATIFEADTPETWNNYNQGMADWDEIKASVFPADVVVKLYAGDSPEAFQTITGFKNGDTYPLDNRLETLRYVVLRDGEAEAEGEMVATRAGQRLNPDVILLAP